MNGLKAVPFKNSVFPQPAGRSEQWGIGCV